MGEPIDTDPPAVTEAIRRAYHNPLSDVEEAVRAAYAAGLTAGRTAAASAIRAEIIDGHLPTLRAMNAAYEHAARIAETTPASR